MPLMNHRCSAWLEDFRLCPLFDVFSLQSAPRPGGYHDDAACVCVSADQGSARERGHVRIPVLFGDSVQAAEHDGQNLVDVLLDEAEDVLVIPQVQSPLCYLPGHKQWGTFQRCVNDMLL